jgi:hypothetical protein
MFGVLSSLTTACHAIVIKDSLKAVDGSTMALAWYSNALSAIVMLPISIVCAEGPEILRTWTDVELLRRFLWGTAVTVRSLLAPTARKPGDRLTFRDACLLPFLPRVSLASSSALPAS